MNIKIAPIILPIFVVYNLFAFVLYLHMFFAIHFLHLERVFLFSFDDDGVLSSKEWVVILRFFFVFLLNFNYLLTFLSSRGVISFTHLICCISLFFKYFNISVSLC